MLWNAEIWTILLLLRSLLAVVFCTLSMHTKYFKSFQHFSFVYEWSDFRISKISNYFGTCFHFVQLFLVMFLSHTLKHMGLCISNINSASVHSVCLFREMKHNYSNSTLYISGFSIFVSLLSVSHVHCTLCVYFYLNKCDVYFYVSALFCL